MLRFLKTFHFKVCFISSKHVLKLQIFYTLWLQVMPVFRFCGPWGAVNVGVLIWKLYSLGWEPVIQTQNSNLSKALTTFITNLFTKLNIMITHMGYLIMSQILFLNSYITTLKLRAIFWINLAIFFLVWRP